MSLLLKYTRQQPSAFHPISLRPIFNYHRRIKASQASKTVSGNQTNTTAQDQGIPNSKNGSRLGHTDFKRRYKEIGTKRLLVHNFKNPKAELPATFQIDPTEDHPQKTIKQLHGIWKFSTKWRDITQHSKHSLQQIYLPADYPESVAKEYLPFTIYQNIMSVCASAMGFLSTQSMFVALGGSCTQAQLASAAYNWVLKDLAGQFGGIIFAAKYGQNFDEDIKKWRFMATLSLNISIYIEIMVLYFPHLFLLFASTANASKSICFLLAGASRAQINVRLAKRNNVGDISGKATSQFTTSSIVGMLLGSALTHFINVSSLSSLLPTFFVLSVINLYASYKSALVVNENFLNNTRAALIFDRYFQNIDEQVEASVEQMNVKSDQKPEPFNPFDDVQAINLQEKFYVPNMFNLKRCRYIRFGDFALIDTLTRANDALIQSLMLQLHKDHRKFTYHIRPLSRFKRLFRSVINNGREHVIHINMRKNSSNQDQFHAYLFARMLDREIELQEGNLQEAKRNAELKFAQLDLIKLEQQLAQSGWSLDYIYLDRKRNRYEVEAELIEKVTPSEIPVKNVDKIN